MGERREAHGASRFTSARGAGIVPAIARAHVALIVEGLAISPARRDNRPCYLWPCQ